MRSGRDIVCNVAKMTETIDFHVDKTDNNPCELEVGQKRLSEVHSACHSAGIAREAPAPQSKSPTFE